MSKVRGGTARPIRLCDSARKRLSRHAIEVFQSLDLQRDPADTTSPEALRALLEQRHLPVHEAALDLEALAGGTPIPPDRHLGVFAALRSLEGGRGRPLGPEKLPRAEGQVLLPVIPRAHPALWIGASGALYLVDTETFGVVPAFDDPVQYLEALAILLETEPDPSPSARQPWHYLGIAGRVGAALASELDIPEFPPASGTHGGAWIREHLHLIEQNTTGLAVDTQATTTDPDEAVALLRAALAMNVEVRWSGPEHRPPAGQRPILAFSFSMGRNGPGREVAVYGGPGHYRFATRR
ncbi:hypothetical protein [Chondromyces apiculatus]|uniref:Uncharacterized protein n=1 Tax=Chondromyces apiculatus DSM 436 TaxID=1192034 RepID=A0A017T6W1_9BACT|nr:hypothetical protein [Chondromyces apiculatus]EYF04959.1 Hypothetical protein CAP_3770 [Chondromyces apiculatus DSM 436]